VIYFLFLSFLLGKDYALLINFGGNVTSILITGSSGLIGSHLSPLLERSGFQVVPFDLTGSDTILDKEKLSRKLEGCGGIIHLAAVSRVVWGERDPVRCRLVNCKGTKNVIDAALVSKKKPWILYASSREVYGEPKTLPVKEDAFLNPLNVYACSKVQGEFLINQAKSQGLITSILRFSNVFGGIHDHGDRVIPAFCLGALSHKALKVEGSQNLFDFTYIEDVIRGILLAVLFLEQGKESLPPIHLTSGQGTTLMEAAEIILSKAQSFSKILISPPRHFDVSFFVGDPERAKNILGWGSTYTFEESIDQYLLKLKSNENSKSNSRISTSL